MASDEAEPPKQRNVGRFVTTRWSIVLAAGERATPDARDALTHLCAAYWYPIYAYVRRHGHDPDEAQDLTQSFFARLLEKHVVEDVRRERGRCRSFLRGGNLRIASIDVGDGETRYAHEPSHARTPEQVFERRWALTVLDNVLRALESETAAEGKANLFERLKCYLSGDAGAPSYAETGA